MSDTLKHIIVATLSLTRRILKKIAFVLLSVYQKLTTLNPTQISSPVLGGKFYHATFPDQPTTPQSLSLKTKGRTDAFFYRLTGHAKGHYSLAIVNRALAIALYRRSDAQTCFIPFEEGVEKTLHQIPDIKDRDLSAAIEKVFPASPSKPLVSIVHHYPVITDGLSADIRVIIFFWEESSVPHATISVLNENFDAILVAAEFVATSLRNSGCNKPIFVIPLGVDHLIDYAEPLMPLQPVAPGKPFRFLHVSSVFDRKGPEFLLQAFIQEFNENDNVELYIKTFPNPHNRIHQQLAKFFATKKNPPRVIIDETDAPKEALQAIYRSAHTLVLPTRGEGFNLPAAEALALGLPVIVTGFGAHTDFCTTQTALLIPFRFDLSQSHLKESGSCWVTPDALALSALLRQSVNEVLSQSESLSKRREAGYVLMRNTYTWDQAVQGITNALHWLVASQSAAALDRKNFKLPHISYASLKDLPEYESKLGQADALILQTDLEHIAHSISVELIHTIRSLAHDNILILEIIGTNDSDDDTDLRNVKREMIQVFLNGFDRVIVQSLEDYNQMLGIGEIRNVVFLPLSISQELREMRIQNMLIGLKYDRKRIIT